MSLSNEQGSYVIVAGLGIEWAIDAALVIEITREADWTGEPPRDVAALWSTELETGPSAMRVLSVQTSRGIVPVRAGRLSHRIVDGTRVATLPAILRRERGARLIAGIVFDDDQLPLVVLDPEGLRDELDGMKESRRSTE